MQSVRNKIKARRRQATGVRRSVGRDFGYPRQVLPFHLLPPRLEDAGQIAYRIHYTPERMRRHRIQWLMLGDANIAIPPRRRGAGLRGHRPRPRA